MKIVKLNFLLIFTFIFAIGCKNQQEKEVAKKTNEKPNIVIIYLDDLGYGDISAYGATEIQTPNIDALASGGIKFTNGYASSVTCTPSRYALLTGMYPWRNKDAKILPGTAPLLISTTQQTLPKVLKKQGYQTSIVGKWHLGLGTGHVNWNERITPGPNEVGFDQSYIFAATQDRVPTVYIDNGTVVGLDKNDPIEVDYKKNFKGERTAITNPEMTTMKWHHGHKQQYCKRNS
jgi:arylsulfatase A-like enzyme